MRFASHFTIFLPFRAKKWSTLRRKADGTLFGVFLRLNRRIFPLFMVGCEQKSYRFLCKFALKINGILTSNRKVFVAQIALLPHINGEFLRQSPCADPKQAVFSLNRYLAAFCKTTAFIAPCHFPHPVWSAVCR